MIALYIIVVILALIVLMLLIKAELVIEYKSEFIMYGRVLFLKIPIVPGKKKKIYRSLTPAQIKKLEEKKLKKAEKKQLKKEKKRVEDDKKNKTKAIPEKRSFSDTLELVLFIKDLAQEIISRFFGRLKTRVYSLRLLIGMGDASTTGLTYAAVMSALSGLLEFLDMHSGLKIDDKDSIGVYQYYTDKKIEADIKISFSLRLYQALSIVIPPGWRGLVYYIKRVLKSNDGTGRPVNKKLKK